METTTKTAAVRMLHTTAGWRFWGFHCYSGDDIGEWPTMEAAIAGMAALGFRLISATTDQRASFAATVSR